MYFLSFRLLAANPTLSEQSVSILLERGLDQVDGGQSALLFVAASPLRTKFFEKPHYVYCPLRLVI